MEVAREIIYEQLGGHEWDFRRRLVGTIARGRAIFTAFLDRRDVGRVAFIMPPRGFSVTVESLDDALAWLTIERAGGTFEAQLRFSRHELPQERMIRLETEWVAQLKKSLTL